MQEHGQQRLAQLMGLLIMACTVLATSGCANMYHLAHYNWLTTFEQSVVDTHRPYFHSGRTGRIIAKHHRHSPPVEPDCFGYEPTCWYNWPSHCVSCPPPDQIIEEEVVEPLRMQEQPPEEAPLQPPTEGVELDNLLDLDDPQPGEQPIVPNRGRGASVAPPAQMRQVAPEPRSSSRPGMSVTQQEPLEAESSHVAAYRAAISRRGVRQDSVRQDSVEHTVRPRLDKRDDRPLAFVDREAEVASTTPDADISLPTSTRPAPPAIAPSLVQSATAQVSPSLVQAESTPATTVSSRRTIRFAAESADDQVTADTAPQIEQPKPEAVVAQPPVEAVPANRPEALPAKPVQTPSVQSGMSTSVDEPTPTARKEPVEMAHEPLVQIVQEPISLPSFKITAVGPRSAEKSETVSTEKTDSTNPAATIRFVSGKQARAVRLSARELTTGEGDSDLKFR